MRLLLGAVMAFAGVLIAGAANAQTTPTTQQLYDTCYAPGRHGDDDTISSCGVLIASGQYSGVELSHLYNNRGTGYHGKKQLDLALSDYLKSIQLDPSNAEAHKNAANIYYDQGDYRRALGEFDTAIQLKPDYAHAYHDRGLTKQQLGDADGGQADLDMAARLEATMPATEGRRQPKHVRCRSSDRVRLGDSEALLFALRRRGRPSGHGRCSRGVPPRRAGRRR